MSPATPGTCWFCGQGRGGGDSVAYPFHAQGSDEVRVVVVPRCDACTQVHRAQMLPSGILIAAAAMVPPALITLLAPVSDGIRTALCAVGMVVGVVAGIFVVSGRERRAAARRGTRPAYDALEHEGYKALAADTAGWRQQAGPGMNPDSTTVTFRRETVEDYRRQFGNDAKALAALERGCREAGVAPPA